MLNIFEQIGSDTKRSHKLAVIQANTTNSEFMRVTKLALDPYIKFHIQVIPTYTPTGTQPLSWGLDQLEKLSSRTLTGHAGIEHLRNVLSSMSVEDATVIERVIGKDLRCGMADGIVNAVVPNFIPTYPCLLARPYDAKNIKNIIYPAFSQLKADGLRANAHCDGKVMLCGRSGREIDLLGELDEALLELAAQFDGHVVFDGEFVVVDANNKIIDRKTGNGIINKAIKNTIGIEDASRIRFQIWDVIPMDEFKAGKSSEMYEQRFYKLVNAINTIKATPAHTAQTLKAGGLKYWAIPTRRVNNLSEAEDHFQEMLAAGQEGTIIKNYHGLWEDTRSKHLVKMKAEKTADLEIIGWNPGEGKFVGMVGSLICASSDRKVEASISGFSDDLRKEITRTINERIGTIVEVMYNERISSKATNRSGVDSLFLPRFNMFRPDKTTANSTNEIK